MRPVDLPSFRYIQDPFARYLTGEETSLWINIVPVWPPITYIVVSTLWQEAWFVGVRWRTYYSPQSYLSLIIHLGWLLRHMDFFVLFTYQGSRTSLNFYVSFWFLVLHICFLFYCYQQLMSAAFIEPKRSEYYWSTYICNLKCTFLFFVTAIVVVQNATVLDLKRAIQRYIQLKHQREGGIQHVSW